MNLKNEEGYALASVLFINTIIVMMLFALLTIVSFSNTQTYRLWNKRKIELACYSAVQIVLNDNVIMSCDSMTLKVDSIEVKLKIINKGFYREITSSAKSGKDSIKIKYILGIKSNKDGYFSNALVLSNPYFTGTISGNTQINGNILSSANKFVIGNIYGEPAGTPNFLKGRLKVQNIIDTHLISDSLFTKIFESYGAYPQELINEESITEAEFRVLDPGKVYRFKNNILFQGPIKANIGETIIFRTHGLTEFLANSVLKANTIIFTDTAIIRKGCSLEKVILCSNGPILVEEGCYFKDVQLFSKDSIHVNSSQFDYPTIICLNPDGIDSAEENKSLVIENSVINGSLILMSNNSAESNKSRITIDKDSEVQGLVYSENNLELIGRVSGMVFTYNLYFYKSPTLYINWLVNIKINIQELDTHFLLPAVFIHEGHFQIISQQWIY